MGLILETGDDLLCLERRRESYNVADRQRVYQSEWDDPRKQAKSEHIFVACDGEIEVSATFLLRLVSYFMENPDELDELKKRAEP